VPLKQRAKSLLRIELVELGPDQRAGICEG
jgi:hypothetical protein